MIKTFELQTFRPRMGHFEEMVQNLSGLDVIEITNEGKPVAVIMDSEHFEAMTKIVDATALMINRRGPDGA